MSNSAQTAGDQGSFPGPGRRRPWVAPTCLRAADPVSSERLPWYLADLQDLEPEALAPVQSPRPQPSTRYEDLAEPVSGVPPMR